MARNMHTETKQTHGNSGSTVPVPTSYESYYYKVAHRHAAHDLL